MNKIVAYLLAYTLSLSTLSLYGADNGGNIQLMIFFGVVVAVLFLKETTGEKYITTAIIGLSAIVILFASGFNYRVVVGLFLYVFEILIFLIGDYTFAHNRSGSLLIMAGGFVEMLVLMVLMSKGAAEANMYFQQWMLTKGDEAMDYKYFFIVLAVGSITFFAFSLYYLLQVRYRISLVVMISLLPCVLYAKIIAEMDNYYLVLIALFNILAGMYHARKESLKTSEEIKMFFKNLFLGEEGVKEVRPVFVAGYAGLALALAITLICAVFPRKKEAVYYDRFEEMFLNNGSSETEMGKNLSSLNEISGNAEGYRDPSARRLFTLRGKRATYLKRQNFDLYDFDKDYWTKADEFLEYGDVGRLGDVCNKDASIHRLQEAMKEADELCPGFLKKYGLQDVISDKCMEETVDEPTALNVYPNRFNAEYFLRSARPAALINHMGTAKWYNIYIYEDKGVGGAFLRDGGGRFNLDRSIEFLEELNNILRGKNHQMEKCAQYFLQDAKEAQGYQLVMSRYNAQVPESVLVLTNQIIAGCKYDYEKAYALQDYFYNGDFTYDIEYIPEDDSLEYFLFTSKTGSCSDFATAYAVMARAAGLTVRYAEGFVPTSSSRPDTFYIRQSGSHAYPEVFLPLIGWSVFEPTISGDSSGTTFLERLGFDLIMDFSLVNTIGITIIVITLIFFSVRMLYPLLRFLIFGLTLLWTAKEKRPYKRYVYLTKRLAAKYGDQIFAMTPRELEIYYKEISKGRKDISRLVNSLEESIYKS